MNKTILLFIICSMQLLLIACTNGDEVTEREELKRDHAHQLTMAFNIGFESGFDPIKGWGGDGSLLFHSTLFKKDEKSNLQNDLAVNYEVEGKLWTVHLRDDVAFSDGRKLTANDVAFTYNTLMENNEMMHSHILDKINVINDTTIEFHLQKEQPAFMDLLINTGIVPRHAYSSNYYQQPVGSGPYQLVEWKNNEYVKIEVNKLYYDTLPQIKEITILLLPDETIVKSLKNGQIDLAYIPATYGNEKIDGMRMETIDTLDFQGISFPILPSGTFTKEGVPIGNDITSNLVIRQAINIAIDRSVLVDQALHGFGSPAYTPVDQLQWWNEETKFEDGNVTKAKAMLNQAGWKINDKGIFEKNGLIAEITLYYPAHDSIRQSLAVQVANMLKDVGISVQVEGADWDDIQMKKHSNPILIGWGSDSPYEMYRLYSSDFAGISNHNPGFYKNDVVNQYFEKALHAPDEDTANKFWKLAQWDGKTGFSARGDAVFAWLVNRDHIYFINEGLNIGEQHNHVHGHGWSVTRNIVNWRWEEE